MAAALNGINLFGGLIAYGGTFLIFSDYMRPAIRLAARLIELAPASLDPDPEQRRANFQGKHFRLDDAPKNSEVPTYNLGDTVTVGIFAPGPLAFSDQIESGSQQPSLADMARWLRAPAHKMTPMGIEPMLPP